jgi:hypothetical protein
MKNARKRAQRLMDKGVDAASAAVAASTWLHAGFVHRVYPSHSLEETETHNGIVTKRTRVEDYSNLALVRQSLPGDTFLYHTAEHSLIIRIFSEKPKEEAQYNIPVDKDGTPLFPSINLNTTTPAAVKAAIMQYMEKLWSMLVCCRRDLDH